MAYIDKCGVEFSDDRKTLVNCPRDFKGEYIIPDSVTSIVGCAFSGCSGLTSVTIPNSVTSIGDWAFSGCSSLTSVTIPNSVTSIGAWAFHGCSSLTSVTIPNSVTSIEYEAFSGCSGLTSVTIPNSVTSIGDYAFDGCSGLTSVTIPNSVTSIGGSAFSGCSGLTSVTIPNSVTSIGGSAFSGCSGLTSVTIPNSVTSIVGCAFFGCSGLTSVTIPNSVTNIGEGAFGGCSGLTTINVSNDNQNYIAKDGVLFNKQLTTLIQYPAGKQGAYAIPNSVTSIGQYAFYGCSGLTSVTISNSVTSIGDKAFDGCSGLTSVHINDIAAWCAISFMNSFLIGGYGYSNPPFCHSNPLFYAHNLYLNDELITDLTIPNSVTSIVDYAFAGCSSLTSVTIPNSITSIGNSAFSGCSGLTSMTIPNRVTSIGDWAFYQCSGLTSVTIPNSVTSIGEGAFEDCDDLTDIYVPKGQKERFAQMVGLEDIKHLIVEKADVALNDRFTIRKLLYNNKITCFYHFTSRKNIVSICQHGGLYSWHYLKAHQIDIPLQGGGELSQGLDRYKGVADYVHLSFCENHPMAYHLIQEGEDIVVLKISTEVALLDGTMFTDMNAVDSQCSCAAGLEGLQKVNIAATKEKYLSSDNPLFKYKQAEILVKTHIPLEYILNIDEFL